MDSYYNINNHIVKKLPNIYSGSEKKWCVVLDDGCKYMLKFPDPIREQHRDLSYMNNAFSEYIGCRIFESVGIPVQETKLGIFTTDEGKEKVACLCKDLRADNEEMVSLHSLSLEYFDELENYSFDLIQKLLKTTPDLGQQALDDFYDRFIVDAFIGNPDRHSENSSVLVRNETDVCGLSPVYDCGSCLSPLISDAELSKRNLQNAVHNTVCAIRDKDTNAKLYYKDVLFDENNYLVGQALCRIVPKIDLDKISRIINDIPYLSDKRKDFYISVLKEKYEVLLIPSLKKHIHQESTKEYKCWSSKIIQEIYDRDMACYCDMKNGDVISCRYADCDVEAKRTNDNVFIVSDIGYGVFTTNKTNKNVSDFVSAMRQVGIDIPAIYGYPTSGPSPSNGEPSPSGELSIDDDQDLEAEL